MYGPAPLTSEQRLESMLPRITATASGCWLWTGTHNGARDEGRRGRVIVNGHFAYAYRVLYEILAAPIPEGLTLDHLCRVPLCVNPTHLEPVTMAENTHRNRLTETCRSGLHPASEMRVRPDGGRHCGACNREWARGHFGHQPRFDGNGYRKSDDFCRHGHPLVGENQLYEGGYLVCRTCVRAGNRIATAKYKARKRAERLVGVRS